MSDVVHAGIMDAEAPGGRVLFAGIGAGIAAAAATAAAQWLMGARIPPIQETAWSAFIAGLLGGPLYAILVRLVRRPIAMLWLVTLAIATVDSVLIAALPLPRGHGLHLGIPIDGLIVPIRQLAALAGIGHFGARHFPAAFLPADTVLHYIPAAAVAWLVPRWADARDAGFRRA